MNYGRRFAGRSVVGKVSIVAAFTLALQSLSVAAIAAPPTSTAPGNASKTAVATTSGAASGLVKQGKAALAAGNYDKAIELLSKATVTLGMTPASCDAHFNLGKAFCEKAKKEKLAKKPEAQKDFLASRKELRTAVRLGRGSVISVQANQYLLTNIPAHLSAPRTGEGTELIAARFGLHGQSRGIGGVARAQVFEFFAPWCQPCTKLKPVLAKIQKDYGDQIEIKSFNVDDDSAQDIIDQYEVSPIPTVIFLTPDSKVVGYSVGFAGEKSVNQQLAKILANNPAPATPGVATGAKNNPASVPTTSATEVKTPVSTDASVPVTTEAATPDATTATPAADAATPLVTPKKPVTVAPPVTKTSSTSTTKPSSTSTTTVTTTKKTAINAPTTEAKGKTAVTAAPVVKKSIKAIATTPSATEVAGKTPASVVPVAKTSVRTSTTVSKKPTTTVTTTRSVTTSSPLRKISRVVPSATTPQVETASEKTGSRTYEHASKTTRSLAASPVAKPSQDAATVGHSQTSKKVIAPASTLTAPVNSVKTQRVDLKSNQL